MNHVLKRKKSKTPSSAAASVAPAQGVTGGAVRTWGKIKKPRATIAQVGGHLREKAPINNTSTESSSYSDHSGQIDSPVQVKALPPSKTPVEFGGKIVTAVEMQYTIESPKVSPIRKILNRSGETLERLSHSVASIFGGNRNGKNQSETSSRSDGAISTGHVNVTWDTELMVSSTRTSTPFRSGSENEGQGPRNGDVITEGGDPISEGVNDRSMTGGPGQPTLSSSSGSLPDIVGAEVSEAESSGDVTTGGESPSDDELTRVAVKLTPTKVQGCVPAAPSAADTSVDKVVADLSMPTIKISCMNRAKPSRRSIENTNFNTALLELSRLPVDVTPAAPQPSEASRLNRTGGASPWLNPPSKASRPSSEECTVGVTEGQTPQTDFNSQCSMEDSMEVENPIETPRLSDTTSRSSTIGAGPILESSKSKAIEVATTTAPPTREVALAPLPVVGGTVVSDALAKIKEMVGLLEANIPRDTPVTPPLSDTASRSSMIEDGPQEASKPPLEWVICNLPVGDRKFHAVYFEVEQWGVSNLTKPMVIVEGDFKITVERNQTAPPKVAPPPHIMSVTPVLPLSTNSAPSPPTPRPQTLLSSVEAPPQSKPVPPASVLPSSTSQTRTGHPSCPKVAQTPPIPPPTAHEHLRKLNEGRNNQAQTMANLKSQKTRLGLEVGATSIDYNDSILDCITNQESRKEPESVVSQQGPTSDNEFKTVVGKKSKKKKTVGNDSDCYIVENVSYSEAAAKTPSGVKTNSPGRVVSGANAKPKANNRPSNNRGHSDNRSDTQAFFVPRKVKNVERWWFDLQDQNLPIRERAQIKQLKNGAYIVCPINKIAERNFQFPLSLNGKNLTLKPLNPQNRANSKQYVVEKFPVNDFRSWTDLQGTKSIREVHIAHARAPRCGEFDFAPNILVYFTTPNPPQYILADGCKYPVKESWGVPSRCDNCHKLDDHSTRECTYNTVCVFCSGKHESKKCPNTKTDRKALKCVNCRGNHASFDTRCPQWVIAMNIRKEIWGDKNIKHMPPNKKVSNEEGRPIESIVTR